MDEAQGPPSSRFQRLEGWLGARRAFLLLVLAGGSILLRFCFFLELRSSPCMRSHEWTQSDMHFFHEWAGAIASGDWLSDAEHHPLMDWQRASAAAWFSRHPGERGSYGGPGVAEPERARRLWNEWFGGKRFHQEPLYVYLVALTYAALGPEPAWVFAWQMLLGVGVYLLVAVLARRYFGEVAGAAAGLLVLFFAPLLFYELQLVRTTLTAFVGLGLVWAIDRAARLGTGRAWAWAGLASGLALLCQTTFAPLVLGAAALLAARGRREGGRELLRRGALLAAGVAVAISPAVVRNLGGAFRRSAWPASAR